MTNRPLRFGRPRGDDPANTSLAMDDIFKSVRTIVDRKNAGEEPSPHAAEPPEEPSVETILDTIKRDAHETNVRHKLTAAQADATRRRQEGAPTYAPRPQSSNPPIVRRSPASGMSMLSLLILVSILLLSLTLMVVWLLRAPAPPLPQAQMEPAPPATRQPPVAVPAQPPVPVPAPMQAQPATGPACTDRFARLLAGFTMRRQELLPFVDDEIALMACRRELDWENPDHLALWGVASLLRRYPSFTNAADLFAAACIKGGRIGCAWGAVWPQGGPYPLRDAQEVLRRLQPYLDGTLPAADTMAALALLSQSQQTPDALGLAKALLERAAAAGDIWAAEELVTLAAPRR